MIPREMLAPLPLFRGASPSIVDAIAAQATEIHFDVDAVVFLAGSKPRGWFIVIDGMIRVVRGSGGRQHVIHTEGPGGTLGEVPLFTDDNYPATAIAAEPTRCALLDRESLDAAMHHSPELGFLLARRLALRVRSLVDRLDNRSARSVRNRLVDFLLERCSTGSTSISMGMTQQALAEELGTVREVLARELQALAREGFIASKGGGRYEIVDSQRLRAIAER
jgi:CRP/FNR family transcriptional regulator